MTGGLGLGFAVLALLCQLLSALLPVPVPVPGAQAVGLLAASSVICRAGGAPVHDQAPAHHPADCALCPACLAAALPALLPAPEAVPVRVPLAQEALLPPARAGPAEVGRRLAAQPRGPPVQT